MAARGLRRDMRRIGEFAGRQGSAVEQGTEDVGARRIADEGRDGCHVQDFAHGGNIAFQRTIGTRNRFGRGRSDRRINSARLETSSAGNGHLLVITQEEETMPSVDLLLPRRTSSPWDANRRRMPWPFIRFAAASRVALWIERV